MTAKTPASPRKTTTRSRKKTATPAPVSAADATEDTGTATEAPAEKAVAAEAKPAPKKRVVRRRKPKVEKAEEPAATAPEQAEATPATEVPAPVEAVASAVKVVEQAPEVAPEPPAEKQPAPKAKAEENATPELVPAEKTAEITVEAAEDTDSITFADLELSEPLLRAISDMGYTHPTPIQAQAIPAILMARDVMGVAQTGTGKTASFTLPMLEILADSRARARMPRSLILEPTRELALQVAENFVNYGKYLKLNHALLIGGESMADQKEVLNRGVDVLIATPGRLLDLFERGGLMLNHTGILVIDEADRMLDMGFIPDIEKIVGLLPPNRQTLLFSATMAPTIRKLADTFLHSPKEITVARQSSVATTITTGIVVVDEYSKRETLRQLLKDPALQNAIVFCNRKRDVDILTKSLVKHGFSAAALHGDLPQSVRFSTLEKFKNDELKVLVCSDVAARGIDIGGLSHVFNFDLPFHAEDYVHRIGRTGRAGREGHAYSIATPYDKALAEAIEKLTGKEIPRMALDGVKQLEWSDEKRPPAGRTRKPHTPQRNRERENPAPAAREQQQPEAKLQQTARPERQPTRNTRHQRDEIPPAPGGDVQGFGDMVPAFMLLPRRNSVRPASPGTDATAERAADTHA
ncbi:MULTISPECIES: DEAD/DEAH box helicase [Acetobacter]|uniref:DEAD-box ATP-dependent RNA helicase RhpA n=1 Tax=Acetobacter pomorum DM001 TaxID=945681 RepID=F1YTW7_9PROT|nr:MULTISPECIES: DEAD/DEAH box helicase [Acetobacter]ATI13094.1 DNA helicase [Acetobacter pomorum]AXC26791.1 DNA helicase [Acetobacter sp. JWB]EGE47832.1 ATP-dependent RNA helicase RhlE [Acetobacter pomorum DM001]KAA8429227.1 DEAD/DEAH box helicase [Acetobacter pomorum]KAA8436259.1 DEAD/DEAH box helicase [Acetobacter pomorum]